MPTLEATQFKCPECGGRLSVAGDATSATCSYCGTVARVQRRTQFLQRPIPLEPAQDHESPHVARQVRSVGPSVAVGVVVSLLIGGSLTAVGIARRSAMQPPVAKPAVATGAKATAAEPPSWSGATPLVADVDNDGVDDFLGIDRTVSVDTMRFAAYSGKDGHVVWKTPSLGTFDDVHQDVFALAGDALIVGDNKAHLAAFEVATGKPRWHVDASEVVDRICTAKPTGTAPKPDSALVVTADHIAWSVALADGVLTRAKATCPEPPTFARATGGSPINDRRLHVAGMRVSYSYARGDGPIVASGRRDPGTSVPMVAAFDKKGNAIWHVEVPSQDPLTASMSDEHLAIGDDAIAAVYKHDTHQTHEVAVFDRATGARRFDTALQPSQMDVVTSVVLTRDAVAVVSWGNLQVIDLATGKPRFMIGK